MTVTLASHDIFYVSVPYNPNLCLSVHAVVVTYAKSEKVEFLHFSEILNEFL